MKTELDDSLKACLAMAAGVPFETRYDFDPKTNGYKVTFTTAVPCDVQLINGKFIVATLPNRLKTE